jgi:hypothetical protein
MKTFIVSYDLCKPGKDYASLLARLRALGGVRPLESFWVLEGNYTAPALRDDLRRFIDANDRLVGWLGVRGSSFSGGLAYRRFSSRTKSASVSTGVSGSA